MSGGALHCKKHPAVAAGFDCDWCRAALCPDCTAKRVQGTATYYACCLCGGPARQKLRPRRDVPYLQRLKTIFTYPFSSTGLVALLGAGAVLKLVSYGGWRAAILGFCIVWAYIFTLIRSSAAGSKEIQPPDFSGLGDLAGPAFLGTLATMVVWVPAVSYVLFFRDAQPEVVFETPPAVVQPLADPGLEPAGPPGLAAPVDPGDGEGEGWEQGEGASEGDEGAPYREFEGEGEGAPEMPGGELFAGLEPRPPPVAEPQFIEPPPFWTDPIFWLLALIGLLYAPMALLLAGAGASATEMLNPVRVVLSILKVAPDYAVMVGLTAAFVGADVLVSLAGGFFDELVPIPFVPGWIAKSAGLYFPFLIARAFGLLIYARGAELGCLPPSEEFEAVDAGQARGVLPMELVNARPPLPGEESEPAKAGLTAVSERWSPAPLPSLDPQQPKAPGLDPAFAQAASALAAAAQVAPGPLPAAPAPQPAAPSPAAAGPLAPPSGAFAGLGASASQRGPAFASAPLPPEPFAVTLQDALHRKDFDRALALYGNGSQAAGLAPALLFEVGRAAAGKGSFPVALQAFKSLVTSAPADPLASKSLVLMARVYGEKLGDAASAKRIYAHVAQRYPGTEAAEFARKALGG